MKNIVIVGYPKSGNTWVTRLAAELIQCPVSGFWYSSHEEIAKEGMERISEFACYKSHHQLHKLESFTEKPWKIIYVIRDPRDIVFSGIPYFYADFRKKTEHQLLTLLIPDKMHFWLGGRHKIKREMIQAVLHGNANVHAWCKVSWSRHMTPFLQRPDILKIKYEALLEKPVESCKTVLQFLSLSRTDEEISRAIYNQSFDTVKTKLKKSGVSHQSGFLHKGKAGYWKDGLTASEKELFIQHLKQEFQQLGYV